MPIYTGRTADGSDISEVEGVYINPKNPNEWSIQMYPEQIKEKNLWDKIFEYVNGKYSMRDIYQQIKEKRCPLPLSARKAIVELFEKSND